MDAILHTIPSKISDRKLEKSKKYKAVSPYSGSVRDRISDMRFPGADYFIETYCSEIQQNVYIFIRKRQESDQYVIVSFFRKKATFTGISTYWLLKEKESGVGIEQLYKRDTYKQ